MKKRKCGDESMWNLIEEVKTALLNPDEELMAISGKKLDLFEHPLLMKCSKPNNDQKLLQIFYKVITISLKDHLNIDLEENAIVVNIDTRTGQLVGEQKRLKEVDPAAVISLLKIKGTKIYHGNFRIMRPLICFLYYEEIQKGIMTVSHDGMTYSFRFTLAELPMSDGRAQFVNVDNDMVQ
jgi:hypothetical protein